MHRTALVFGCAAWLLLSTAAHADGNPTADELFRAAKASMARGEVAQACSLFAESLRYEAASGTQLNLADCEQRSGHLAHALALFEAGRARLPPGDFRIPFTDERIASLTKQVPMLTVLVRGESAPGTKLSCDGEEIRLGVASRVDPGAHVIVVRSPSRADRRVDVALSPGESRILEVDARDDGRIDAVSGAQVDRASSSGRGSENGRHAAAYVAGSIGIAGLAVGVVTGLMTMQAASTYKDHCVSGQCDSDGLDAASTGRTLQVVSPIAFAVGAVGIGTGAWLWFTAPSPTSARAFLAPAVAPGTAGVSLRGAF